MSSNVTRCIELCVKGGYATGTLSRKDFFCPFEYYCSCTCLESVNCSTECDKEGKINKETTITKIGCKICKCSCPDVDCDAKCGGKGFGIQNTSNPGCKTCVCEG